MKYDIERIALWVIVAILAIAVFFPRRGSGFMLTPNIDSNLISIMDLKEFSMVTPEKRNYYKSNVLNTSNLMSIASGTSMNVIPMLDMWLASAVRRPSPPPITTTTSCPANSTRNTMTGQCVCNTNYTWNGSACVQCPPGRTRTGAMASGPATQCI